MTGEASIHPAIDPPVRAPLATRSAPQAHRRDLASIYLATLLGVDDDGRWVPATQHRWAAKGFHVITAWNPGAARLERSENDRRSARLRADLEAIAAGPEALVAARGADARSPYAEDGWAVVGLDDAAALSLGARYAQVAIFRCDRRVLTVVACTEGWAVSRDASGDDLRDVPAFKDAPLSPRGD